MAEGQDQDRTEEPTPFKLRRAREKGQVARGQDLGFLGSLAALAVFLLFAGPLLARRTANLMRSSFTVGLDHVREPADALSLIAAVWGPAMAPLVVLGATVTTLLVCLELVQLRGFVFAAEPLKPDFNRLNPAKGLKRLFSVRILKETGKNIAKFLLYGFAAWLVLKGAVETLGRSVGNARALATAMDGAGVRLVFAFIGVALLFAVLDQMIVRKEFRKQMRMSKRELTRETRDREGEPRIRQKRKQLHAEVTKQHASVGGLGGSDVLVTNPDHYAIGLRYDPATMSAPQLSAKGRNRFALALKAEAARRGVPIVENRPLARALFRACDVRREVPNAFYRQVADIYLTLRASATPQDVQGR